MNTQRTLETCLPFINAQFQTAGPAQGPNPDPRRLAVTISRQTGSGAHSIAEKLAAYLQAHGTTGPGGWRIFDRNLVDKVLEDHNLPRRLARFMPEDGVAEV